MVSVARTLGAMEEKEGASTGANSDDFIQERDSIVLVLNNEKYYFEVVKRGR